MPPDLFERFDDDAQFFEAFANAGGFQRFACECAAAWKADSEGQDGDGGATSDHEPAAVFAATAENYAMNSAIALEIVWHGKVQRLRLG